jgi:hypothetical protein
VLISNSTSGDADEEASRIRPEETSLASIIISYTYQRGKIVKIPQTTHSKTAQIFSRSFAGAMTRTEPRGEEAVLHDPSHVLTEFTEGTEATNDSEEEEKSTLVEEAFSGDGSGEARSKQSSQDAGDETKTLKPVYLKVHSSDDASIGSSRDIPSEEYKVIRPSWDENELAAPAHLVEPPQKGSSSSYSSRTPPRIPEQDANTPEHPSDRDVSIPSFQRLLHHDPGTNSRVPARWRHPQQIFRAVTIPSMVIVLLGLFAPNGVGAVPIVVHQNSSRRAAALLPTLATEGLVLITSVAWLLRIARSLTEGRDQRDVVPLCAILIAVLPLSMFAFGDVNLESR